MEQLENDQLKRVSDQLKKYGIESPELRAELTDHYAGEIEEQMLTGKTFEEAFAKFAAANSWLKLRKLEHQHLEFQHKSFRTFLLLSLRELLVGRKAWIGWPLIAFLYYLSGLENGKGEELFFFIQGISAGMGFLVITTMVLSKKYKIQQNAPLISLAMMLLYLSVFLPVTDLVPLSHPVFDGFYLAQEVNTVYYAFWVWGIHITLTCFRKMRRKQEFCAPAR